MRNIKALDMLSIKRYKMPYEDLEPHQKESIDRSYSIIWLNSEEDIEMLEDVKTRIGIGCTIIYVLTTIILLYILYDVHYGKTPFSKYHVHASISLTLYVSCFLFKALMFTLINRVIKKRLEILYP